MHKTYTEIQEQGEILHLTDELTMVRPGGQWSQIEVWACETGDGVLNDGAYEFVGILLASDDLYQASAGHAASGYKTRRRLHDARTAAKMTVDRPADTERGGMATMMTADDLGSMLIRTGDLDVIGAYYDHLGVAAIYCRPDSQGMLHNEMFEVPAASPDEAAARVDEVMATYRHRRHADLEARPQGVLRDIRDEMSGVAAEQAAVEIRNTGIPPGVAVNVAISLFYRPVDPGIYTSGDGWATYAGLVHAGSGHAAADAILSLLGSRKADVALPVAGAQVSHRGFRAFVDCDSGDEPRHATFEVPAGTIGGAITALASAFADFFGADDDDQPEPCPACHGAPWDSSADDPHGSMPCDLCGGGGWVSPDQEMIDWIEGAEVGAGSGTIAYWAGEEIPLDWTCPAGIPEAGRMIAALPAAI